MACSRCEKDGILDQVGDQSLCQSCQYAARRLVLADTDENRLRRFEIRGIDQKTDATQGEPQRFGFAELFGQLSDPDADAFMTIDQLLALGVGDSLRFGGGAAPLFRLQRLSDYAASGWRVSLRKYRSTWHWFTANPQGGGFGSSHQGAKSIAYKRAFQNIPAGAQVQVVTEHDGREVSLRTGHGLIKSGSVSRWVTFPRVISARKFEEIWQN